MIKLFTGCQIFLLNDNTLPVILSLAKDLTPPVDGYFLQLFGGTTSKQLQVYYTTLSLTAMVVTPTTAVQDFPRRIADWCWLSLLQPI